MGTAGLQSIHTGTEQDLGHSGRRACGGAQLVAGVKMPDFELSFGVADVDAIAKAVVANGGEILLPKTAIPTVGHLIYFRDTEGNIAGAMQYDSAARRIEYYVPRVPLPDYGRRRVAHSHGTQPPECSTGVLRLDVRHAHASTRRVHLVAIAHVRRCRLYRVRVARAPHRILPVEADGRFAALVRDRSVARGAQRVATGTRRASTITVSASTMNVPSSSRLVPAGRSRNEYLPSRTTNGAGEPDAPDPPHAATEESTNADQRVNRIRLPRENPRRPDDERATPVLGGRVLKLERDALSAHVHLDAHDLVQAQRRQRFRRNAAQTRTCPPSRRSCRA